MYQSNKLKLILWLIRNKNKTFGEIFGFSKTLYGDLIINLYEFTIHTDSESRIVLRCRYMDFDLIKCSGLCWYYRNKNMNWCYISDNHFENYTFEDII